MTTRIEKATFAAGCFWGVEAAFRAVPGVVETAVGYIGGTVENPTYELVCAKGTGHAEAVEVVFDPDRVSYDELLEVFWDGHDPTQLNRQGPDIGDQYRSAIFFHDDDQRIAALRSQASRQTTLRAPIVTQLNPATRFWRAEEYHQRYYEKHGLAACRVL